MPDTMLLTTDTFDPERSTTLTQFSSDVQSLFPADYVQFIEQYGAGTYCDETIIGYPDAEHIPKTYRDYTSLWKFDERYTEDDLLQSIRLGWTIDGDLFCVTPGKEGAVFVLPRHDQRVQSFPSFFSAVESLTASPIVEYFDPMFDSQRETINLIQNSTLVDIMPIYRAFLNAFQYDFVVDEDTQPKYVIKAFGGWVSFDLIYKNSIAVKYQAQFVGEAQSVLDFLRKHVS